MCAYYSSGQTHRGYGADRSPLLLPTPHSAPHHTARKHTSSLAVDSSPLSAWTKPAPTPTKCTLPAVVAKKSQAAAPHKVPPVRAVVVPPNTAPPRQMARRSRLTNTPQVVRHFFSYLYRGLRPLNTAEHHPSAPCSTRVHTPHARSPLCLTLPHSPCHVRWLTRIVTQGHLSQRKRTDREFARLVAQRADELFVASVVDNPTPTWTPLLNNDEIDMMLDAHIMMPEAGGVLREKVGLMTSLVLLLLLPQCWHSC